MERQEQDFFFLLLKAILVNVTHSHFSHHNGLLLVIISLCKGKG